MANDGGLPIGTVFPTGLTLCEHVPQGHKVALVDLPEGAPVLRYNVTIGYALKDIRAGSWVHERLLDATTAGTREPADRHGLAQVPVIKVATRSELARRWHDLMDLDAGTIATGEKTIEEVGWELFRLMLEVASGRKRTWAEHWKLHNALVLFNPAPVT